MVAKHKSTPATERKDISRTTRFEVFKRDKFTCQYCGRSAPEVILHVDHIEPVSKGGENSLLNYVTACLDCNEGKGARRLSDSSAVTKQKHQLDELQERREQLQMMLEWREGLRLIEQAALDAAVDAWEGAVFPYELTATGMQNIKRYIHSYGINAVLAAITDSTAQYLRAGEKGPTKESVQKAFNYVGAICAARKRNINKPYMEQLYFARGILRNRHYINEWQCIRILEDAHLAGVSIEEIRSIALESRSWTSWKQEMLLAERGAAGVN